MRIQTSSPSERLHGQRVINEKEREKCQKNAAQSISRPFKLVNNSSLIFLGKIVTYTHSQLDVEKTIEMDDWSEFILLEKESYEKLRLHFRLRENDSVHM